MLSRRQFLAATAAATAPQRPNIVLILADDLGLGDLSCYGGDVPTPNLDALAATGIRFTHAYTAAPICSPSRVGITTGQCPARHGIFSYLNNRAAHRALGMRDFLDPAAPSLARSLRVAGYATAHFGKWHMGGGRDIGDAPLPQAYGFDESFTSFEGLGDRVLPPGPLSDQSEKLGRGKISRAPKSDLTRLFVDRAIDFASRHPNTPFYLQLWPDDVHDPFAPTAAQLAKFPHLGANKYRQQFAAVLDEFDRQLGRLLTALRDTNTLIVFLSDNGPTAWPRYYNEKLDPPGSTAGLRGRKWSLYEGGIRTPLIARWPGRIPAGRVDETTVLSALDLFPTLARLAGAAAPPAPDGEDMSAAFLGRPRRRAGDLFWEYGRAEQGFPYPGLARDRSPNCAIRSGPWKLLQNADGSRAELYHLGRDPRESQPVSNSRVENRLRRKLSAWRNSLPAI